MRLVIINESGFRSYDFQVHSSTPQYLPPVLIVCDFFLNMTRTVEQVPPAGQPQMEGRLACSVEVEGDTTIEGLKTTPGDSNIETLPAIEEGIDRPGARSENCDGSTHRRQQDPTSQVVCT